MGRLAAFRVIISRGLSVASSKDSILRIASAVPLHSAVYKSRIAQHAAPKFRPKPMDACVSAIDRCGQHILKARHQETSFRHIGISGCLELRYYLSFAFTKDQI